MFVHTFSFGFVIVIANFVPIEEKVLQTIQGGWILGWYLLAGDTNVTTNASAGLAEKRRLRHENIKGKQNINYKYVSK
jgi:hypothetical protein